MQSNDYKASLKTALAAITVLLLLAGLSFAQQQVNLTAAPSMATLADGSSVPMWGYSCGAVVTLSTASCAALNPNAGAGSWSPVLITVPTGQGLTINLTNNLSFQPPTPTGGTTPSANNIPTSIVIVGQVGGGLGTGATYVASPDHSEAQANVTWPIANTGAQGFPPPQGQRVRSFSTEVAAVPATNTTTLPTALTWPGLRPGTYLLESGTHPSIQVPMGLIGVLVVTTAPASGMPGTAYPNVSYNAELPLEFSEIDPFQNRAVNAAVNSAGFSENATYGPYGAGPVTQINVSNGGSGYTSAPTVSISGGGGSGATATATIDTTPTSPTYQQVIGITVTNGGTGYTAPGPSIGFSGGGGTGAAASALLAAGTNELAHCGEGLQVAAAACYPPAVNYTPFYYLINGVAFNKTNANGSLFSTSPAAGLTPGTGQVLVRLVNAGLRMHVPAIVGSQTNGFDGAGKAATVTGFSIVAEDGNVAPGVPKVQSDVFMAAGKTFDVMINVPSGGTAVPVYDRELSLSGNASERDAGMLAYIGANGAGVPADPAFGSAVANADIYNASVPGQTLTISDPSKGVIANDINVYGVAVSTPPTQGTLTLNLDGTFTYAAIAGWSGSDSFGYCANGTTPTSAKPVCTTVSLGLSLVAGDTPTCSGITFNANMATYLAIKTPGLLASCSDPAGLQLTVDTSVQPSTSGTASGTVTLDANGGFNATATPGATTTSLQYTFTFNVKNSVGKSTQGTATVIFPAPSNLAVVVKDPSTGTTLTDYRWVIEEDKTFYVNPNCTTTSSSPIPGCPSFGSNGQYVPATFGVNFHTSHMEYIAQGCTGPLSCESGQTVVDPNTGAHNPTACDVGNGACTTPDLTTGGWTAVLPSQVFLDPGCGFATSPCKTTSAPYAKRYYISILPGDAANAFNTANRVGGHTMGGAPISFNTSNGQWNSVTALVEPNPLPTGKLSVQVFEDDFPLNGEQDAGGGIDVIATNEPGLGGFNIVLWDDMGGSGDVTGQMTYDMFNQPLSNSLAGTIDPATGNDACPISKNALQGGNGNTDATATGITGMIVTCPKYESDGTTVSPLAGQAVVANLMPGRFSVQAIPGADRIARGEEWLQTNTLDGQHPHDSFIRIGEPNYFQEYGPAGFHVSIGFANPAIINARAAGVCNGTDLNLTASNCTNTVTGRITAERMSRTPDERLYSSGSRDAFYWTQCFVSLGDPDGEDFLFTKCDANGNFKLTNVPTGTWRLSIFDQWNDQLMDGLSTPVSVANGNNQTVSMGDVPVQQWQANVYTRTFVDDNKDGVYQGSELGIPFLNTTVRYRDGSLANNLLTDFTGTANFNETFPLFNWYVVEADTTRYKTTGIHTVYDAGGPADGTTCGGNYPACGAAGTPYANLANTIDQVPLPGNLSVPGAVYCTSATCNGQSIANGPTPSGSGVSTGRIDPPWVAAEAWQGFSGQNNFIEFGKTPYIPGENGGIYGHVIYASTRPFDDPQMLVQTQWEPLVPHVTINLYQEGVASDGVTPTLKLVDYTQTSSWDDWAQGFRSDGNPNMNCPGQGLASSGANQDLFFYTIYDQPNYLDLYNSYYNGGTVHTLPYNSRFKCYDGMHNWNQLQPAPYDGMYSFPSVTGIDPHTGNQPGRTAQVA